MKYIFFIFCCLFLCHCQSGKPQQDTVETVKYEQPTLQSLRDLIHSIEIVRLDHQDHIVMGALTYVFHRDSSFYIADPIGTRKIFRFAENGLFRDSIGTAGRGAEEYQYLEDFYISDDKNEIYIQSFPDIQLYRYDKKGRFLDKKQLADVAHSFTMIADRCWLYSGYNNGYHPEQVLLADTNLQLLNKYLPLETKIFPASMGPAFFKSDEHTHLIMPFNETVYEVTHDTLFPVIRFDFGKLNVPSTFWTSDPFTALDNLDNNGFINLRTIFENKGCMIAELNSQCKKGEEYEDNYYCGIKNKKTGNWDWIEQEIDEKNPQLEWYAGKIKGFAKDNRLMVFLSGYESELLTEADYALITNPEILKNTDPEMDMFLLLCTLK